MLRTVFLAALVCACFATSAAQAKPRHSNLQGNVSGCSDPVMRPCAGYIPIISGRSRRVAHRSGNKRVSISSFYRSSARPRAWCGWWLGRHLGMTDRKLWLARNWVHVGRPAYGPHIGAIVVWARGRRSGHVGIITGKTAQGWVVKSGNDGHAVRERVRSVSNAIAFRWPS